MSSAEVSYLYNADHEFLIDYRLAQQDDQVKVYLRFTLNSGLVKIGDYNIRYDLRNNYISEKKTGASVRLDSSNIIGNAFREFFYAFEFEKKNDENLVVIEVENIIKGKNYFLDIPIATNPAFLNTPFLIFDKNGNLPVFTRHINKGSAVRIKNVFKNEGSFEINGKVNNRPVAMPPFDETKLTPPTLVRIDTVYGTNHNELFVFNTEGFYTINESSAKDNSIGILIADKFFPNYGDYKQMSQPLIYISTSAEFNNMRESTDVRKEFENFVVNTINDDPLVATEFVKYYYRRVKNAGFFFTTTQEGWKTDKGMLYQIFGNPRQVFRNETSELWVYAFENGGRMRFTFDIKPGDGSVKEFSLIRGKKYRDIWMAAVTRWRNGQVIE